MQQNGHVDAKMTHHAMNRSFIAKLKNMITLFSNSGMNVYVLSTLFHYSSQSQLLCLLDLS